MRTLLLALVLLSPALALAQYEELENPGSLVAIQERKFQLNHELSLSGGVLPGDAFYKGVTGTVAYTAHFSDHFAWQVGRGTYSYSVDTGLREQLERDFGVLPTEIEEVNWMIGSDLVFKPLYGKFAVMNQSVIYLEAFVLAGASAVSLDDSILPAANIGVGVRLFLNQHVSMKLEAADHLIIGARLLSVPIVNLGLALNFGGDA